MTADSQYEDHADALEALAGGTQPPSGEPAGPDAQGGSTSGLMLLSEDEADTQTQQPAAMPANPILDAAPPAAAAVPPPPPPVPSAPAASIAPPPPAPSESGAADPLASLAAASGAAAEAIPDDLASVARAQMQTPEIPAELGEVAAATTTATGAVAPQHRAARLQVNTRRAHGHAYKQTMIPLLIVVGLLLVAFSVFTMITLMGGETGDEASLVSEQRGMQKYGKYFILASLPLGAILLMGAWLFYMDVRKHNTRSRR